VSYLSLGTHLHEHDSATPPPIHELTVPFSDTNNPADVATICGVDAKKTESAITDKCGGSDSAMQFFANTCAENGHKLGKDLRTCY